MLNDLLTMTTAPMLTDEELVIRVQSGDQACLETLMRRHNQRLYRIARGILRNDVEAEEAVQDTYVRAYTLLDQFEGRGRFSSWLGRILANEALVRLRKRSHWSVRQSCRDDVDQGPLDELPDPLPGPGERAESEELRMLIESAIDDLPARLRAVFVLRAVEQMTTSETAECLGIPEETVKTRLFRAKARLRKSLDRRVRDAVTSAYPFLNERCDRIVAAVFRRVSDPQGPVFEQPA